MGVTWARVIVLLQWICLQKSGCCFAVAFIVVVWLVCSFVGRLVFSFFSFFSSFFSSSVFPSFVVVFSSSLDGARCLHVLHSRATFFETSHFI